MVERPTGEGHASGERRGAVGVEPEGALLHPYRGGKAGVDLGEAEPAQGPAQVLLGGAAEHLHGRPFLQAPPRRQGDRRRRMQRDMREDPALGRHAGLPRPFGRADQQRRRLVDGPLAGVPPVVGVGQWAVVRPRRGDVRRVAAQRERRRGVVAGHRVEPGPERSDLLALAFRREMQRRGEGVLNERVLLHGRPDHAGRDLHGGHEIRRPRQDLVGRVVFFVGLDAAVPGPGPRLGSGNDDGVGAAARHQRQRVVDHLLLGDADLAEQRARPGRADAPGDGARRVGE